MMIKIKNKKGDASPVWWIIVTALLAILVVIFILIWFKGSGDKAFGGIGKNLDSLGDYDNDKVANFFDKCPCTPVLTVEEPNLKGCPKGTTLEQMQVDNKLFSEKNCVGASGGSSVVQTPESKKIVEQSKQPIQTTFSLSDNGVNAGKSSSTSSNQLLLELGCAKKCTLTIIKPVVVNGITSSDQEVTNYNAGSGASLMIPLQEKGSYMICLKEEGAKEMCYNVKKN